MPLAPSRRSGRFGALPILPGGSSIIQHICRWHKALNPKGLRLKHNKFNQLYWMKTQKWSRYQWESLGEGNNLERAIMDTINQQTEFGDEDPVNNYRLKGQGLLTDIRLSSN